MSTTVCFCPSCGALGEMPVHRVRIGEEIRAHVTCRKCGQTSDAPAEEMRPEEPEAFED